ncbi:MAG TPA: hypothetical protein VKV04_05180 [Verrucomicrobiae bacterium]|nr:hypothetical protein [Verrucomicrobiae bacterium]
MKNSSAVRSRRRTTSAIGSWLSFVGAFPAGLVAGCLFAHGRDPAGRGIAVSLGMLGVGLLGGILSAVFVSRSMLRLAPNIRGKLLAILPWIFLTSIWWIVLFTPLGDRLAAWLQSL